MLLCRSVPSCKRVAVQNFLVVQKSCRANVSLMQKWLSVQKWLSAKVSPHVKVTLVQKWRRVKMSLVQKRPCVQKWRRAKVSPRDKVTLVQKCCSCKSDLFPHFIVRIDSLQKLTRIKIIFFRLYNTMSTSIVSKAFLGGNFT